MIGPTELQPVLDGLWAVHPGRNTGWGSRHFTRRPRRHLAFDWPAFQLYETGSSGRLERAAATRGLWRIVDLDGQALLVLTVRSYRPSRWSDAILKSNYGYSGGAMVVTGAQAARDAEARTMRDGGARMYFLPVQLEPAAVVVTLPSDGGHTPRQRWTRVRAGLPRAP